ncbi:MAG: pyridoxamine 5'-phosphate oxidase [Betaproteobacteria bacterium]|nr:pyridoxamine 5'-phosphate oxidase [Betaproteobacteria bacterium]
MTATHAKPPVHTIDIAALRTEYRMASLDEADVATTPLAQFDRWFQEALKAEVPEGNAMTLATCDADRRPSARVVLLKDYDHRGFVFYTNYESHKGHDLATNNRASLLFFWPSLERQVRIQGRVEQVSAADSDAYFKSRPLGSRIGAWASRQSEVIASRTDLESRWAAFEAEFGDNPPRPPHWGGYRVVPQVVEFWQGRESRLHDRIRYRLSKGEWTIERLAP